MIFLDLFLVSLIINYCYIHSCSKSHSLISHSSSLPPGRRYICAPAQLCVCVKVSNSACGKTLFHCGFWSPSPSLSSPRVYHGGLPWQPQKWPVRALGNVDVQIMTCWKPWTTSLSPAGNWFFYQFIVSSCTAHHWYSYFRNRGKLREKETEINMSMCARAHICIWFWRGCRCALADEYMCVYTH